MDYDFSDTHHEPGTAVVLVSTDPYICAECIQFVCSRRSDLETRKRMRSRFPHIQVLACTACGSRDYYLAEKYITIEDEEFYAPRPFAPPATAAFVYVAVVSIVVLGIAALLAR